MLLKVTIKEGVGQVFCPMPAFQLSEYKGKTTVFVSETTPALKELQSFDMVTIEKATFQEYRDFLVKVSINADRAAKKRRIRQLKKRLKTGGKEHVILGSGVLMTVDPGDASTDVVKQEAQEELKKLEKSEAPPVREDAMPMMPGEPPIPTEEDEEDKDIDIDELDDDLSTIP